jgi:putative DNA primase/helicase
MNALRSMAAALGGDVVKGRAGAFVLCPGPGHSAKDRSLSVTPSTTDPDGFVCFSHANNDWRDCRKHVLQRLGRSASEPVKRQRNVSVTAPRSDNSMALALWREGGEPRGTLAQRYIEGRRLELFEDVANRVVRFHPSCPFGPGVRHPCMLLAFRSIADDELQAIHRTALDPEAKKIGRKMLGPVAGAAIKIDADEDVEQGLAIGEGFETGLAGRMLGFRPVWALGSANAIASFPVLPGIDALTILAETDDSGANAQAIKTCGNRWAAEQREVIVATPRVAGDMNTVLQS